MILPGRVGAAEYAKHRVLATVTETRFGSFVHDGAHDHRAPATQLVDTHLPSHGGTEPPPAAPTQDSTVEALLSRLDSLYERHGFDHRVLSGVDRETFARLAPVLRSRSYERERYWALVPAFHDDPAPEPTAVRIEAKPHGSDDARTVHEAVGRDPESVGYLAEAARELDGMELVAYRRGESVGVAGWYVHGDGTDTERAIARYTHVGVDPDAAGDGIGSALVAAVVKRCPLPPGRQVVCATEETAGFYEGLGFTRNNQLWRFARLP